MQESSLNTSISVLRGSILGNTDDGEKGALRAGESAKKKQLWIMGSEGEKGQTQRREVQGNVVVALRCHLPFGIKTDDPD